MGFQFMLILGLVGMYLDAAVVFVTKSSLLFKLAMAILTLDLFATDPFKIMLSEGGFLWKL